MDLHHCNIYITALFLLVCGCKCIPRPYEVTNTSSTSTVRSHRNPSYNSRSGGWNNGIIRPGSGYRNQSGGGFVFPTEPPEREPDRERTKHNLVKPGACNDGSKFCNDSSDYPSSIVEELLENSSIRYRALLSSDIIFEEPLTQRAGDGLETPLCDSEVEIVFPKKAEDRDGKLKYVVNHGEYKQGIRVEKCRSSNEESEEDQKCEFADSFPQDYKAVCKQNYIYRKMIALRDDGTDFETREFPIPSCCSCVVRNIISRRKSPRSTPNNP